jgi:hypothetical protein
MGLELERREARKEAWVGCEGCCFCSGSLRRVREVVKARVAVDERAREECFWGVRRWRRVCWRRVRMHDVQTVEEDILWCCWWCWYNVVEEDGDSRSSPSKFP